MVVLGVEFVHLLEHAVDVLERLVVHALAHEPHDGDRVGADARREPQRDDRTVLEAVRGAMIERSPTERVSDPRPVRQVPLRVRPAPPHHRVRRERQRERRDPALPITRLDDLDRLHRHH